MSRTAMRGGADGRWLGRAFLFPSGLLYSGISTPTDTHAHHAHQIMVGLDEEITVAGEGGRTALRAEAFAIPADAPHAIVAAPGRVLVLWVDPEHLHGRTLKRRLEGAVDPASWAAHAGPLVAEAWTAPETLERAVVVQRALLAALGVEALRPLPLHPALAWAAATASAPPEGLVALAAQLGLSADRLGHLFREQLGTTYRAWVRWRRLRLAVDEVRRGASLTDAAHAAGFSDAAHMSRTFRRMFGVTPSDAVGAVEWLVAAE